MSETFYVGGWVSVDADSLDEALQFAEQGHGTFGRRLPGDMTMKAAEERELDAAYRRMWGSDRPKADGGRREGA